MERQAVDSSLLVSIGYDADDETVEAEFKSKPEVWQYFNVPLAVYDGVISAKSIGSAFISDIRKAGYRARRVS